MESKQLWTIVGISLVVALAVTLVSGAVSSGPLFSPKTSANAYVKAHSCDADGSCEVNSLLAKENGVIIEGKVISTGEGGPGNLVLTSNNGGVDVEGDLNAKRLNVQNITNLEGTPLPEIVIGSYAEFMGKVRVNNALSADILVGLNMRGNGTAYVCVDHNGYLIRSNTPCR